ncbi:mucin-7-like [Zingiber officinale]|uniref:mucin-7-like n=1 Tax=Zingiber officinale TaxID=94328 RepID=UPI001C4C54C0|nr:mucin-7-like [Zingiber officinale]
MLRAYSSYVERQSFSILKVLSAELKQGLATSSRSGPSASQSVPSVPSASQSASPAPAQEEASSALPPDVAPIEDMATVEQVEEERAASPPSSKRIRLQRKRKKVTPATQASPPPLPSGRRSPAVSHSSEAQTDTPDRETALGPEVPILSPRTSVPTPDRAITPEQASFPA